MWGPGSGSGGTWGRVLQGPCSEPVLHGGWTEGRWPAAASTPPAPPAGQTGLAHVSGTFVWKLPTAQTGREVGGEAGTSSWTSASGL